MLHPMTLSATSAFDPSTSFFRAPVTARTTSSGRMVDVRRISSRIDSKRFVSGEIRSIVCAVALMEFSGRGSLSWWRDGIDRKRLLDVHTHPDLVAIGDQSTAP